MSEDSNSQGSSQRDTHPTDSFTRYIMVESEGVDGVGPFADRIAGFTPSQGVNLTVLWTEVVVPNLVVVIISKDGAVMWHSPLESDDSTNQLTPQELANDSLEVFKWYWEDESLNETLKDYRVFIFKPDNMVPDIEHAIETLRQGIIAAVRVTPKETEYQTILGSGRAHVEVEYEGSDKMPRVVLNGKQVPPAVPRIS